MGSPRLAKIAELCSCQGVRVPLPRQDRTKARYEPSLRCHWLGQFCRHHGSHLLTMEFLISLNVEETGIETKIYFHFFNEQFEMTLKQFSIALDFHQRCILDPNTLAVKYHYDRSSRWSLISDEPMSSKNSIDSIHNPTLRFLAKWFAMVVHPRADLCLCSLPELQCLFAMANKNSFFSRQGYARSLAKVDLGQRHIEPCHSHCEPCQCVGKCRGHLLAPDRGVQICGRSRALCAGSHGV